MNLALVLNHRCNLRCRYCYTGRKFDRAMSLDVAKKAVDFGLAHSTTGHLTLSFFGGEPLLEIEAMQAVVIYAERRAQETSHSLAFSISTNGTLLDEHRLSLLRDHAFHVQVSIDGDGAAQNLTRPYEDGRPSHDDVAANLRRLVAENLLEQIVAVIDPTTAAWLRDSYGYLASFGAAEIYFSPNYLGDWNDEACAHFEVALRELGDAYLETFRQGRLLRVDPLYGKIVSHLIQGKTSPRRCGFGAEEMAVAPSGNLYPCDRMVREDDNLAMRIGHVEHGLDQARCDVIQASRRQVDPECSACDLRPRCMQWCGCAQWETTHSLGRISSLFCWFERSFVAEADRIAGILFGERNPTFLREFYGLAPAEKPAHLAQVPATRQ
ncbi:MAG TPA: radical SAM protein [Polyangia bacterium]